MTVPLAEKVQRRMRSIARNQLRDSAPGRRLRLQLGLAAVERYAGRRPNFTLLDAGSEEGLLCLKLARRHPRWILVAADIAEEPLRRGRAWAQADGLSVHYVRSDLQKSLGTARYDAVVALESLVEIPDDRAAMRSMVNALRGGGLFVAHVPTADWTPVLPGAERVWRREARHGYDAVELIALLDELSLDVEVCRPTFRRVSALAQDVRDLLKRRSRLTRLMLVPLMAAAVTLERAGLTWGPARGLFIVAVKR